ncbi:hypothetical protein AN958_04021 [Leucoagaricus sp. SymC.cos]|nr:hypothetical protein AN958_04021 [Leucoagaricus sp. SymC.cos]
MPDETRISIIQYAASGIFCWVHHSFISEEDWKTKASKEDLENEEVEQEKRWCEGVKMFTTLDELLPRRLCLPSANAAPLSCFYYL